MVSSSFFGPLFSVCTVYFFSASVCTQIKSAAPSKPTERQETMRDPTIDGGDAREVEKRKKSSIFIMASRMKISNVCVRSLQS